MFILSQKKYFFIFIIFIEKTILFIFIYLKKTTLCAKALDSKLLFCIFYDLKNIKKIRRETCSPSLHNPVPLFLLYSITKTKPCPWCTYFACKRKQYPTHMDTHGDMSILIIGFFFLPIKSQCHYPFYYDFIF